MNQFFRYIYLIASIIPTSPNIFIAFNLRISNFGHIIVIHHEITAMATKGAIIQWFETYPFLSYQRNVIFPCCAMLWHLSPSSATCFHILRASLMKPSTATCSFPFPRSGYESIESGYGDRQYTIPLHACFVVIQNPPFFRKNKIEAKWLLVALWSQFIGHAGIWILTKF